MTERAREKYSNVIKNVKKSHLFKGGKSGIKILDRSKMDDEKMNQDMV